MKRSFNEISDYSDPNPPKELLLELGRNALSSLNSVPNYSRNFIPLLNLLGTGITPSELSPFVDHGTSSAFTKAMHKASNLSENPLIEPISQKKPKSVKVVEKNEAQEYLVSHTKQVESSHRLITKESVSSLFADYVATVENPLEKGAFTEVYRHLRIIKDKHCNYNIYNCPKCEDDLPIAEALVIKLVSQPQHREDYEKAYQVYQNILEHKSKAQSQTNSFETLWHSPPEFSLIVAEDAGKRFVLDGKGCAHIMMTRYSKNNGTYYFFLFFKIIFIIIILFYYYLINI